jgi:hypothetical protein
MSPLRDRHPMLRACPALAIVSLAFLISLAGAGKAQAGVPDPAHSECPASVKVSPNGSACVDVIVRDIANNPIVGCDVVIDFGTCTVYFCRTQPHVGNTVSAVTNGSGVAHFCVCAATISKGCVASITACGVSLCSDVPVRYYRIVPGFSWGVLWVIAALLGLAGIIFLYARRQPAPGARA